MAQSWPRRRRRHSVADVELKPSRKHAAASRLQSSYADGQMHDGSRLPSERALVCSSGVIQTTACKQLAGCRRQGRDLRLQRHAVVPLRLADIRGANRPASPGMAGEHATPRVLSVQRRNPHFPYAPISLGRFRIVPASARLARCNISV